MTVSPIRLNEWRLPGCGPDCAPKRHDPHAHEVYGLLLALRTPPAWTIRTGGLVIDLTDRWRVTVDGRVVDLTERQWAVLAYLATRIGQFCPSEDIITAVWGAGWVNPVRVQYPCGQSVRADHKTLVATVSRLRERLGASRALITAGKAWTPGFRLDRVEPTP